MPPTFMLTTGVQLSIKMKMVLYHSSCKEKPSDPMDIACPFGARQLSTNATYSQVVYWCETQHQDKDGVVSLFL